MNRHKIFLPGAVAVILAAIAWGFDGVILTPRLFNLDVGFVVFILHLLPFLLMQIFLYPEYRRSRNFSGKDWLFFLLIACFGGSLGTLAIVKALFLVNFQHLSIVVLLQKLQPIFAILLAALLLGEKIRRDFAFWALLAILASYTLTFGFSLPHLEKSPNLFSAALWALVAAFSFGSSTVFSKFALRKYSYYTTTFYRFGLTAFLMLGYILATGKTGEFYQLTSQNIVIFFIIAVTTGSGALFLYYYGLKKVKASVSTICELFFPLSAIVFDYLFNGQRLNLIQWISAGIMLLAVWQISLNKKLGR